MRVKHIDVDFPVQDYSYNYEMEKKYGDVKYFTSLYFNDEFPVLERKSKSPKADQIAGRRLGKGILGIIN